VGVIRFETCVRETIFCEVKAMKNTAQFSYRVEKQTWRFRFESNLMGKCIWR